MSLSSSRWPRASRPTLPWSARPDGFTPSSSPRRTWSSRTSSSGSRRQEPIPTANPPGRRRGHPRAGVRLPRPGTRLRADGRASAAGARAGPRRGPGRARRLPGRLPDPAPVRLPAPRQGQGLAVADHRHVARRSVHLLALQRPRRPPPSTRSRTGSQASFPTTFTTMASTSSAASSARGGSKSETSVSHGTSRLRDRSADPCRNGN